MPNTSQWKTIPDFLSLSYNRFPNKVALVFENKQYTYRDLWEAVEKITTSFVAQTKKGDRVAILLPNSADFIISYFAALRAGLTVLLIPANVSDATLQFQISKTTPRFIISEEKYKKKLERSGILDHCSYITTDVLQKTQEKKQSRLPDAKDLSTIIFTSGTTSEPKGVMLKHTNVVNATKNIIKYLQFTERDIDVNISQLSHSFGLGHLHCLFAVGGTVILFRDAINLKSILQTIKEKKASTFSAVPAILRLLTKHYKEDVKKCGKSLRMLQTNTSPLEETLIKEILSLLPHTKFCYYYGLTEASRATFITFNDSQKYASVGKASPNVEVKLINGEICIRGKMVIQEYWKNKIASKSIKDGWFHTGDYGYIDSEGYVFFQGRKDDIINVSGEKVFPEEIEQVVKTVPHVLDVAVIAAPDRLFGEVPKALIVTDGKEVDLQTILTVCKQSLESYKWPKQIARIDKIPRTENGKIQRSQLRKQHE